jgi:hypothetical protein
MIASWSIQRKGMTVTDICIMLVCAGVLVMVTLRFIVQSTQVADAMVCESHLAAIVQAMKSYAALYNDAIPGAPVNTARFLYNSGLTDTDPAYGDSNCPSIISAFDWMSPVAQQMGVSEQAAGGEKR